MDASRTPRINVASLQNLTVLRDRLVAVQASCTTANARRHSAVVNSGSGVHGKEDVARKCPMSDCDRQQMSSSATNPGRVRMSACFWWAGYILFLLILLAAPFPLGSNREWAWAPLGITVAISGFLLAAGAAAPRRVVPLAPLVPVGIAFALLMSWVLLTAILPIGPSGATGEILKSASAALNQAAEPRIAGRADAVLTGLLRWLTYALVFWLSVHFAGSIEHVRAMLVAMLSSGIAMTAYSMLANAAGLLKGEIATLFPSIGVGFSGTFVNNNHYATFAGLCALIAVTLVRMDIPPRGEGEPLRARLRRILDRLGSTTGLYLAAFVLMVAGTILSSSRGGALSLAAGLLTTWFLGRRRSLWVFVGVGVGLVALLALPSGLWLITRFLSVATDVQRLQLYELSIQSTLLRPWTGWGVGSFESLYLIFQPTSLALFFDRAHNTYLELMLELGIPFGVVLPLVVVYIVVRCRLGLRERSRSQEVPALAIAGTALVGVHALVDFSLQIPAVVIAYVTILGIGWAQSWSSRR